MKAKGIVALILLAAIPFFASAYVSPGKPTGFVNDFAGILSAGERNSIEATLSAFEKETGNEIVIVTVPTIGDESPLTYGVKLFEEWEIGKKGSDNGLLILHALQERQIRMEVGYGLEPYITDAKASSLYRNIMAPAFKEGKYGEGYTQAVSAVIDTLRGQTDAIPNESSATAFSGDWFFIILFIPIWLASILGRSKSWWLGGVLGGAAGLIIALVFGFFYIGIVSIPFLIVIGLVFDFIVSRAYHSSVSRGMSPPWWIGGGRGGRGFGGGFGGFGGGRSGGGGAGGGY